MSSISLPSYYHSPSKNSGQIQVILGPMFSGKSTELLRRIRRYQIAQRKCLVIKYMNDNRYSDEGMATHDKQVIKAVKATHLLNVKNLDSYSVVGVDEGQFFPDIVQFCDEMSSLGKTVIVAALDGTFERKPFGSVLDLIPIAETVVKLSAVCTSCFREAAFTKRLGSETAVEVIGGADKYMAACRDCYAHSPTKDSAQKSKTSKVRRPLMAINQNVNAL